MFYLIFSKYYLSTKFLVFVKGVNHEKSADQVLER